MWQQAFCKSMFVAEWDEHQGWTAGAVVPYGPLSLSPAAQVLNYGQSIFEGMKAYRGVDEVLLFRPVDNASRFSDGADRMCMPNVPQDLFIRAVELVVRANVDELPEANKGCMYLRPLLMGTGPILGLAPAPSYTFIVYAAPSYSRLSEDGKLPVFHLKVEDEIHRAAPRGVGGTKVAGNYSAVLIAQQAARKAGFSDVIYLDAKTDTFVEEGSGYNIFIVKGRALITPPAQGTILPGITRKSIMQLAEDRGYEVQERKFTVQEALEADEMFATGTAVVVTPVGSLSHKDTRYQYGNGEAGPVTQELYTALTDIQFGRTKDPYGWQHAVDVSADTAAAAAAVVNGLNADANGVLRKAGGAVNAAVGKVNGVVNGAAVQDVGMQVAKGAAAGEKVRVSVTCTTSTNTEKAW